MESNFIRGHARILYFKGSSLPICQSGSYVLANRFKALVKQLQNMPLISDQMGMWQDLMDSIVISRSQISSNDGELFPSALWQVLQISDNSSFGAVSEQINDLMVFNIGDDTAVLVEQIQFVDAQAMNFCSLRLMVARAQLVQTGEEKDRAW